MTKRMKTGDGLIAVKFLKRDAPFEVDDVRLFPAETAERLIAAGVAERTEEEQKE